jgi:ribosome-associated toxin RatA of RatAB toxin-antitoxin module
VAPRTPIRAVDAALVPALPDDVWRVVADVRAYPTWYPRSIATRVERAAELIGTRVTIRPWGGRAFTCRVVEAHPLRSLAFEYDGEFIRGHGTWRLEPAEEGTRVSYVLDAAAVGWAAALAGRVLPLGRVHSFAMRAILRALGREVARRGAAG